MRIAFFSSLFHTDSMMDLVSCMPSPGESVADHLIETGIRSSFNETLKPISAVRAGAFESLIAGGSYHAVAGLLAQDESELDTLTDMTRETKDDTLRRLCEDVSRDDAKTSGNERLEREVPGSRLP